jgi:predicted ester cyclase
MSIQENKAILLRYIAELNRRNPAVIDELVAADFRAAVRQGYQRNITAFPDYLVQVEEIIAEGDKVVLVWNHRGTHLGESDGVSPTGNLVTGRAVSIYQLQDGLIIAADGAWDQAAIWQHLGLVPDPDPILIHFKPINNTR